MKKQDFENLTEEDRLFMLMLDRWLVHFAYWVAIGLIIYFLRS